MAPKSSPAVDADAAVDDDDDDDDDDEDDDDDVEVEVDIDLPIVLMSWSMNESIIAAKRWLVEGWVACMIARPWLLQDSQ